MRIKKEYKYQQTKSGEVEKEQNNGEKEGEGNNVENNHNHQFYPVGTNANTLENNNNQNHNNQGTNMEHNHHNHHFNQIHPQHSSPHHSHLTTSSLSSSEDLVMHTDDNYHLRDTFDDDNDHENHKPPKRVRREKHVDEGYNSQDEHVPRKTVRPRVTRTINEQQLQHVDPQELARCLSKINLQIVPMAKDGNCLFRSLADQLYGDADGHHEEVRRRCLDYMEKERDYFSQFVTEDFSGYLERKRKDATYGNHLELQAVSEIYHRQIQIFTVDEHPINVFQDSYKTEYPPFQLSYHYGNHYNSVRNPNNPGFLAGTGLPGTEPGAADRELMHTAEMDSVTEQMVAEAQKQTEADMVDSDILEQARRESVLQDEMEMLKMAIEHSRTSSGAQDFEPFDYDDEMQLALQLSMQDQLHQ